MMRQVIRRTLTTLAFFPLIAFLCCAKKSYGQDPVLVYDGGVSIISIPTDNYSSAPVRDFPGGMIINDSCSNRGALEWYPNQAAYPDLPGGRLTFRIDRDTLKIGVIEVYDENLRGRKIASKLCERLVIPGGVDKGCTSWIDTNSACFRKSFAEFEARYPGHPLNMLRAADSTPSAHLWRNHMRGPNAPQGYLVSRIQCTPISCGLGTPYVEYQAIGPHTVLPKNYYGMRAGLQRAVSDTGLTLDAALGRKVCRATRSSSQHLVPKSATCNSCDTTPDRSGGRSRHRVGGSVRSRVAVGSAAVGGAGAILFGDAILESVAGEEGIREINKSYDAIDLWQAQARERLRTGDKKTELNPNGDGVYTWGERFQDFISMTGPCMNSF